MMKNKNRDEIEEALYTIKYSAEELIGIELMEFHNRDILKSDLTKYPRTLLDQKLKLLNNILQTIE